MRRFRRSPTALMMLATLLPGVLAVAFFLHAALPDTVELEWHFVAGEPFYEATETSARARGAVEQFSCRTYFFRWLPVEQNEAGEWTIERRLERIKVESEVPGSRMTIYDSATPEDNSAVFERIYNGLVGWQSTMRLSPNYRVIEMTVPVPPRPGSPAADVADFYLADTHREMVESLLIWVQPRRVREYDATLVERPGRPSLEEGPVQHAITIDGKDGKLDRLRATVALQPPPQRYRVNIGGTGRTVPFSVRVGQGIAWFDRAQRRLTRAELYLDATGTVIILPGGGAEGAYQTRRVTRITDTLPN